MQSSLVSQPTLKQLLIAMLPLQHLRFKGAISFAGETKPDKIDAP